MTSIFILQILEVCSPVGRWGWGREEGQCFWGHPAGAGFPTKLTLLTVTQTAETTEQQQSLVALLQRDGSLGVCEIGAGSCPWLLNSVEQQGHFLMRCFNSDCLVMVSQVCKTCGIWGFTQPSIPWVQHGNKGWQPINIWAWLREGVREWMSDGPAVKGDWGCHPRRQWEQDQMLQGFPRSPDSTLRTMALRARQPTRQSLRTALEVGKHYIRNFPDITEYKRRCPTN